VVNARNRPQDLAVKTVTEAVSFSEVESLEKKLIEVIAKDLPELMQKLDGRTVKRVGKPDSVLKTAGLPIVERQMTNLQRALGVIASPAVAGLPFPLGARRFVRGTPESGAVFPGDSGGICLLLALFAMSVLSDELGRYWSLASRLLFFSSR